MPEPEGTNYEITMPFYIDTDGYTDRDREMFVCGVEWQQVYEELKCGDPFSRTIHTENCSRIRMMAGRLNRPVTIKPAEGYEGWSYLEAK